MDIITISGKARHGKDDLAKRLKSEFESEGKRVVVTHFADFLKYICREYYNWNGEKDINGRTLLQNVGQGFRKKSPNCWIDIMTAFLLGLGDDCDIAIVPDCRYPNELMCFNYFAENVFKVRVERPNFDNQLTEEQKCHESEIALDNYRFDLYVLNDGTEEEYLNKSKKVIEQYKIFIGENRRVI